MEERLDGSMMSVGRVRDTLALVAVRGMTHSGHCTPHTLCIVHTMYYTVAILYCTVLYCNSMLCTLYYTQYTMKNFIQYTISWRVHSVHK